MYQLQHTKAGQHVIVDQAVQAARSINPSASGLVNAVLRNFLRRQPALLEAADRKDASRYAYQQWWIDHSRRNTATEPLPFWKRETGIRR